MGKPKFKQIQDKLYFIQELAMEHYDPLADINDTDYDDAEAWRNGLIVKTVFEIKKLLGVQL